MNIYRSVIKPLFDFLVALLLSFILIVPSALLLIIVTVDTGSFGIFRQQRVGKSGKPFYLLKFRTMRISLDHSTSITTMKDPRITRVGSVLRRLKVDEIPQLINILTGHMSFVGPRPDVQESYDLNDSDTLRFLSIRPGITSPASIAFKREEYLLAFAKDPITFNSQYIWPMKVRLNLWYYRNMSFTTDMVSLFLTLPCVRPPKSSVFKRFETIDSICKAYES